MRNKIVYRGDSFVTSRVLEEPCGKVMKRVTEKSRRHILRAQYEFGFTHLYARRLLALRPHLAPNPALLKHSWLSSYSIRNSHTIIAQPLLTSTRKRKTSNTFAANTVDPNMFAFTSFGTYGPSLVMPLYRRCIGLPQTSAWYIFQ